MLEDVVELGRLIQATLLQFELLGAGDALVVWMTVAFSGGGVGAVLPLIIGMKVIAMRHHARLPRFLLLLVARRVVHVADCLLPAPRLALLLLHLLPRRPASQLVDPATHFVSAPFFPAGDALPRSRLMSTATRGCLIRYRCF